MPTELDSDIIGYRIKDNHFKLGSKIHISEFFYAKRMFQNSFYAHRFSFILCNYIIKNIFTSIELNKIRKNGNELTLIGYGQYSELLISRLEYLLKNISGEHGIKDITHNLISDFEQPAILKNYKVCKNALIIIPISSTFSTSVKIESKLENDYPSINLIHPFISLIVVGDGDIESEKRKEDFINKKESDILAKYHWEKLPSSLDKTVVIKTSLIESLRTQKYFIALRSHWQSVSDCPLCFPKNVINEIPIIETDKTSVTPKLIFDNPEYELPENLYSLKNPKVSPHTHTYGHTKRGSTHYLHYLKPKEFFDENKESIKKWTLEIRRIINEDKLFPGIANARVLIISPENYFNSFFVEEINQNVFNDKARVIHFENSGDAFENYEKFFGHEIRNAGFIFFVDDFMSSGKSFMDVNYFVKHIRKENENDNIGKKGVDGIFVLVDRTSEHPFYEVLRKIRYLEVKETSDPRYDPERRFFSFFDLKVPVFGNDESNCSLCAAKVKHQKLFENSIMDTIRYSFLKKKIRLNEIDLFHEGNPITREYHTGMGGSSYNSYLEHFLSLNNFSPWDTENKQASRCWKFYSSSDSIIDKDLFKLTIAHELNQVFEKRVSLELQTKYKIYEDIKGIFNSESNNLEIKKLVVLFKKTELLKKYFDKNPFENILTTQLEEALIKVLTVPPFVDHLKIKRKIFSHVQFELDSHMNTITSQKQVSFAEFRRLKFLLRRSVLLKSNYLIRLDTLTKFEILFKHHQVLAENISEETVRHKHFIHSIIGELEKNKAQPIEADLFTNNQDTYQFRIEFLSKISSFLDYRVKTLFDFDYFIVSLAKELTMENESKTIYLEKILYQLENEIETNNETQNFKYLIRLLKLENTAVIEQFWNIRILPNDSTFDFNFSTRFSIEDSSHKSQKPLLLDYFLVNRDNYKIEPVLSYVAASSGKLNFLEIASELESNNKSITEFSNSFLRLIYLRQCIEKVKAAQSSSDVPFKIEDVIEIVLKHICLIIGINYDHEGNGGAMAVLNYKPSKKGLISKDDLFMLKKIGAFQCPSMFDGNSMVLKMINGISGRAGGNPWTTLELIKQGDKWEVYKDDVFEVFDNNLGSSKIDLTKHFVEEQRLTDVNHFLFFRIATIEEKHYPAQTGQAVLCFFCKDLNNSEIIYKRVFTPEKIKYILLLRNMLSDYLKAQSETDSFQELVEEKKLIHYITNTKHDFDTYMMVLKEIANNNLKVSETKERFDLFYSLAWNKIRFIKLLDDLKKERNNQNPFINFTVIEFNSKYVTERFSRLCEIISKQIDIGGDEIEINFKITKDEGSSITFYKEIIDSFFVEIIVNIKEILIQRFTMYKTNITIEVLGNSERMILKITNTGTFCTSEELEKLKQNGYLLSSHGLNMICDFLTILKCGNGKLDFDSKSEEINTFTVIIPLRNLNLKKNEY